MDRSFAARALAAEPQEILRMLGETTFAEAFAGVQSPAEIDRALVTELDKTYSLLRQIAPEKELIDLFRRRYDYHNLKTLLKAKLTGVPANGALMNLGAYDLEKLSTAVAEKAYRFAPEFIRETANEAMAEYEKTSKLSAISYTCDRNMWADLLNQAVQSGNQIVTDLMSKRVDFANIKTFIRIKEFAEDRELFGKYYIPGGSYSLAFFTHHMDEQLSLFLSHLDKNGDERRILSEGLSLWPEDKSFWRLEAAIDNFILNWFYQMRMKLFSIAPLLYYLFKKEADGKFIRTIIRAKMIGMPRGEIEERVRFLYV
jgi:V/A-type H+-transporting ATPase subunit C